MYVNYLFIVIECEQIHSIYKYLVATVTHTILSNAKVHIKTPPTHEWEYQTIQVADVRYTSHLMCAYVESVQNTIQT